WSALPPPGVRPTPRRGSVSPLLVLSRTQEALMQAAAWVALLRRIPPEQHDVLVIVTTAGAEISIQTLFRTDAEFLVIRGRMAGTTDNGRTLIIPYDQINYLAFAKPVAETVLRSLFDGPEPEVPFLEMQPASYLMPGLAPPSFLEPSI